nr:hypothetical protein [Tanacetum cinerariifolium]
MTAVITNLCISYCVLCNIKDLDLVLYAEMVRKARSHKKVQSVSSQDAQNELSAQDIADAFLSQYYKYLHEIPEEMHKFYKEESTLSIPIDDGSIRSVTTIQEIHEAILESDITDRDIILLSVHAQDSIANTVVVGVIGELSKDNTMKRFSQTFLLAPQATGFYVLNDFFRFLITNDDTEDNLVLMKDQRTSTEDDKISVDLSGNMSSSVLSEKRSNTKKVIKKKSYASIITKGSSLTVPKDTVEVFQKTDGKSSAPPKNEKDITTEASHEVLEKEKSRKSSSTDEIIDTEKGQGEKKSPPDSQDEVEQKKSYASVLAKRRLPTKTESSSAARAKPSVASKNIAKTIFVKNLPQQITRRKLTSAVKKFGNDGYRYAFMEFNSQKAAQLAVEAGFIQFDEWECRVEYKKGDTEGEEGRGTGSKSGDVGDNISGVNNGKADGSKPAV